MAKSIMLQGTASGVGKTILTLALCRIFKQDGYSVAPFKAQNMTSNTCQTVTGDEIAISQWIQAMAAGIEPSVDMNPVILKPSTEQKATQIILNGKSYDTVDAYNFNEIKRKLAPEIMEAYFRLCDKYDVVVIEGAGSPVELNLNKDDIVNMGMAKRAKAPVLLVSDIDRGGGFASLYGTLNLMDERERPHVKATIVNRFMGDSTQFADGVKILEDITKLPVAGVIPYIEINLPEEDGLVEDGLIEDGLVDGGRPFVLQGDIKGLPADIEKQYDSIADSVRSSLDMGLIYKILDEGIEM